MTDLQHVACGVEAPELRSTVEGRVVSPLVLAIDIGSTSTRAAVYDALARPVAGRFTTIRHFFSEAADGTSEVDANQIVAEVADAITVVVHDLVAGAVAAVAIDTFASSLVCVNAAKDALTPCFTYADTRPAAELAWLRNELDESAVHQLVGARLHTSYLPPRLLWLAHTRPEVFKHTARFVSLGEYILSRLADVDAAATSTMAWAGMLNRHTGDLEAGLLEATNTRREQFATLADPDQPTSAHDIARSAKDRWPPLVDAAWFPAIPDGYASNLGVGAVSEETVALSAATSGAMRVIVPGTPSILPVGLWAYRVSRNASILGGALNDVGRVMTWLRQTLAPVDEYALDSALRAEPIDGTPLVLPFLTGERATGWAGSARAALMNISTASGPLELWRGAIEGIAICYSRIFEQLCSADPAISHILASGGAAQHLPSSVHVITQALGFPIQIMSTERITMRGTAVHALSVINRGKELASPAVDHELFPSLDQREYYDSLRYRFETAYRAITDTWHC